jgi:hypothetical protein
MCLDEPPLDVGGEVGLISRVGVVDDGEGLVVNDPSDL